MCLLDRCRKMQSANNVQYLNNFIVWLIYATLTGLAKSKRVSEVVHFITLVYLITLDLHTTLKTVGKYNFKQVGRNEIKKNYYWIIYFNCFYYLNATTCKFFYMDANKFTLFFHCTIFFEICT